MQILVVALNPSIDAEWRVDDVHWEEKNSIRTERRWAGGKGVNVARWLKYLSGQPRLVLPLGGASGRELARGLRQERLPARIIPLREATRVNVVVTTATGRQLRFNPSGPRLSRAEWRAVVQLVQKELKRAGLLVLSGSLPRGVPATAYAELIRRAHRAGVRTLLDCDGAALVKGVQARPFLVKPNEHELTQWKGRPLRVEVGMLRAASAMSGTTGNWILVSRGGKPAVLINRSLNSAFLAAPARVKVRNSVGAGDALLAAVAQAILKNVPPERWLRAAIAAGTAATQCEAGALPPARLLRTMRVRVRVICSGGL